MSAKNLSPSFRSVLVVNRSSLFGTAAILALSAALLAVTGTWLEAGLRGAEVPFLSALASSFAGTLVMITVFIVASVFSGALRPRHREFALLRAVGATASQVRSRVTAEALVLLLIAAPIGAVVGLFVAPLVSPMLVSGGIVPEGFVLSPSPLSLLGTLVVLVPTGLLAARSTARGILRVSPTVAVRESIVEPPALSHGRLLTAAALAIFGGLTAVIPFFAPGTVGTATGASSALLLVVAAGLAGPAVVRWAAIRGSSTIGANAGAGRVLAFANARGFSRRLSAAVIPLALLIALGSVQAGVNGAMITATAVQLREGVTADLIVQSPLSGTTTGVTSAQAAAIAALPGVTTVTATSHLTASVRTGPADAGMPALDGLNWQQVSLLSITPGRSLVDPTVTAGSLKDLDSAGTIAASRETLLFAGKGIGDTIDVRLPGEKESALKIVAIYERGLGFGNYIVGMPSFQSASAPARYDTVFLEGTAGSKTGVLTAIRAMNLSATNPADYARAATQGAGGKQQLSLVLLLALLGFVAAAAANTLAASTRSRRDEFMLLMRLGATRTQVIGMVAIETVFIIVTAMVIGILAVLPALIGAGQGLLGVPIPVFNWTVTGGLAVSAIAITVLTVIPSAWHETSGAVTGRR